MNIDTNLFLLFFSSSRCHGWRFPSSLLVTYSWHCCISWPFFWFLSSNHHLHDGFLYPSCDSVIIFCRYIVWHHPLIFFFLVQSKIDVIFYYFPGVATKKYRSRDRDCRIERVILHRDASDRNPNTRGFGLFVTGGQVNDFDGRLYAYVSWVLHSSPADKMGLKQGDKVLEWDGKCLIDCTYEQVLSIMDASGDSAELIIEPLNRQWVKFFILSFYLLCLPKH